MQRFAATCAALAVLLLAPAFAPAQDANLSNATDAAQSWLTLVDAGSYGESWTEAAASFQAKVTKQRWQSVMQSTRAPLGTLESRHFKEARYQANPPHAPAGKYFIIQYETKFSDSAPIIETVTAVEENDGQWKVAAYYMRPAG